MDYGTDYFRNRPKYKDIFYEPRHFDVANSFLSSIVSFEKNLPATDLLRKRGPSNS